MDKNEVHIAFEILLEEIEIVFGSLNDDGADAFHAGDHDRAGKLLKDARTLTEFHDKVQTLQGEWNTLFAETAPPRPKPEKQSKREDHGKLTRGLRTPEQAFKKPILETLLSLGGSASIADILDALGEKMKGVLNKYDRQRLPSGPGHEVRWRNTAMWSRYKMVRAGLLKSDSPRGVWEISDKGREALQEMS